MAFRSLALLAQTVYGNGPRVMHVGNDLQLLMELFGPPRIAPEEIRAKIPNCTLVDESDFETKMESGFPSEEGTTVATLVWFYGNPGPMITDVAGEYDKVCQRWKDKTIPGTNQRNGFKVQTFAFDMTDGQRNGSTRRARELFLDKVGLNRRHVHDVEAMLFFRDFGQTLDNALQTPSRFSDTSSSMHEIHHHLDDVEDVTAAFKALDNWVEMLVHPVKALEDLTDLLTFLKKDDSKVALVMSAPKTPEDKTARDLFYHHNPSINIAEMPETFNHREPAALQTALAELGMSTIDQLQDRFIMMRPPTDYSSNSSAFELVDSSHAELNLGTKMLNTSQDMHQLALKTPGLNGRKTPGQEERVLYDKLSHVSKILEMPPVVTVHNAESVFDLRLPVLFIGVSSAKEIEPYYPEILKAGEALRGRAIVMIADVDPSTKSYNVAMRLMHHLNIEQDELPAIKLLTMKGRAGNWEQDKLFCPKYEGIFASSEAMEVFVKQYEDGLLSICVRSEPIPEDQDPMDAEILVGSNFHQEVFVDHLDQDLLIDAHAPWCGHCKAFEPQLKKLAEYAALIPGKTLRITKIDATRNDLSGIGPLRGYPSILFYPGGSRKRHTEHMGSRSAEDILKWISDRATNKFDVGEVLRTHKNAKVKHGKLDPAKVIRDALDEL